MKQINVGFALCGSFCTLDSAVAAMERVSAAVSEVTPIMSENAYSMDTRFGKASDFRDRIERICGKPVIATIAAAEPIGPKSLLDILVIAPCTGNTLAKIASGVTDSCVTMAAKAHLRNEKPLLIAVSTNDGLSGNAANIGALINRKNVYFVPFCQDDAENKPSSLIADLELLVPAIDAALAGRQMQPLLLTR